MDALALRYLAATDELAKVQAEISSLREAQVVTAADYVLSPDFHAEALKHLYSNSPESRIVRAELHLKLARLIDHIWVWGYDLAIIEWKDADWRSVQPLRHKTLPSRADPQSKHHRPVPARVVPEGGPFYALAADWEAGFEPPPPQRRNKVTHSSSRERYQFENEAESSSKLLH
jgi:hypothetical protein